MGWMKYIVLAAVMVGLAAPLLWLNARRRGEAVAPAAAALPAAQLPPLRLGLVPERDIFAQRRRFRVLADELASRLGRPVDLVTLSTYKGVLQDFQEKQVDMAMLGSFVTVLVHERYGAQVYLTPEYPGGVRTYRGVIFVRDDSPLQSLEDVGEGCIAMVRATMAGHLFPMTALLEQKADRPVQPCWIGSHDEVVAAVAQGRVRVGAVKAARLEAYEREHPEVRFRRLATSGEVPENGLVVQPCMPRELVEQVVEALLTMSQDDAGRQALGQFGAERFVPCRIEDYHLVYRQIDQLRPHWDELGIPGPPPPARSVPAAVDADASR